MEDGPAVGCQLGIGRLAEELGERGDGVQFVCRNLDKQTAASKTLFRIPYWASLTLACFPFFPPYLRELAVSKPLEPPHAVAGLPLAGGAPRHHDAGPPGEALDLPPHQLTDAETLVVLEKEGR